MRHRSIFKSAITDGNGDVDVGYLALAWGLIGWLASVAVVLGIAVWRVSSSDAAEIMTSIGIAIGGASGGFATMLGAVGLFRMGDKERAPTPGVVTTIKKETIVETEAVLNGDPSVERGTPAKPLHVAVKDAPRRAAKGQGK